MSNENENAEYVRVDCQALVEFVTQVFVKLGVPREDAFTTADNLVQADLRGVDSHGVQRLGRYVRGIKKGTILTNPVVSVARETPSTALIDGGSGLGQPVGKLGMELCLKKAEQAGGAFVAVRNSNHYGIAGYYAMMALPRQMIGLSFTNSRPLAVPTYGREMIIGTNPISIAVPAAGERPFVLDMATSVVPIGKVEVAARKGISIPLGWAVDSAGRPTTDPKAVLSGGGVLPLGGTAEFSGYKGYGLAVMVDILCGVLSGAAYGQLVDAKKDGQDQPANVGHFFAAMRVDAFRPLDEFKATMDDLILRLKSSAKAEGESRIFVAGEKEYEREEEYRRDGIPLYRQVADEIRGIGKELGVEWTT
ncbi:MAG: Ldh family oxidoreductase [Chloroflexi bacterium]|nr:Ldh family oxidoreductase [Chloroflexota bacterium]